MIIDGRNLTFAFNRYGKNLPVSSVQGEESRRELIRGLDKAMETNAAVSEDELLPLKAKSDGFCADPGTVSRPNMIVGNVEEVVFRQAFQTDYTAEDALYNSWASSQQTGVLSVFKNSAAASGYQAPQMNHDEQLAFVREKGLEKEIDWTGVSLNFRGSGQFQHLSDYTDYAAALYVSLEERITKDFSGEEQTRQLDILNQRFDEAVNNTAEGYVAEIESAFLGMKVEMPKDELKQGVRDLMNSKKEQYRAFVKENPNYAGLENSEDKWLERDAGYMANALRKSFRPSESTAGEGGFTETDLQAVGFLGNMFLRCDVGQLNVLDYSDEENIGLAASMNYLMLTAAMEEFEPSDSVRSLAEKFFNTYFEGMMKAADKALDHACTNPANGNPEEFGSLDRDAVYAVFDTMKNTYTETKDAQKSIQTTVFFAYDQFQAKAKNSPLWRYKNTGKFHQGARFWNGMYDSGKNASNMKKLLGKWNLISGAIETKDLSILSLRANVDLFHTYKEGKVFSAPISGGYSPNTGWWGTRIL